MRASQSLLATELALRPEPQSDRDQITAVVEIEPELPERRITRLIPLDCGKTREAVP